MIVSHRHKFIFFAIPKTATHAVRFALRPYLDKNDWEQVELFYSSRLPFTKFENLTHGHITAQEAKKVLGENVWKEYYKFAFVRNPYDRFISYAFFKHKLNSVSKEYRPALMKLMIQNPKVLNDILFKPQFDFVTNKKGKLMVDCVGRFENLQNDFSSICKKVGLPELDLKLHNESNHDNYLQYYDDELRLVVAKFYKKDLEFFDYSL